MLNDYEAVLQLILAENSITSLLGTFSDNTQPLAVVGTIPEGETGMPAISVRNGINTGRFGISENFIEVHCYGGTEPESRTLAKAVYDYFRDSLGSITASGESWSGKIEATIETTIPDQKATNTPVTLKLDYR
jgi:hypothetical protein